MDIKFVGTGGAFDWKYGNSSAILKFGGETFLIDCGHSVYERLCKKKVVQDIEYVLITHLHADHVGSLATFILHHHIFVEDKQLKILYPDKAFKNDLYDFLAFSLLKPEKYIVFQPLVNFPKIRFVDTKDQHVQDMQTYSYYFVDGQDLLAYSGDLGNHEVLFEKLEELETTHNLVFHEISFDPGLTGHTYYKDLEEYQGKYKIYGYHCDPTKNPEDNKIPLVYNTQEFLL